jgi:hypothetical protein
MTRSIPISIAIQTISMVSAGVIFLGLCEVVNRLCLGKVK